MKNIKLFCDFDGTITNTDNIIEIMKKFAPEGWEEIKDQILAQSISIQEGVGHLFSLLPSSKKQEITEFILQHAKIRSGFEEFIEYTKANQIPLYIVSGGIEFFVEPMLEGMVDREQIYCNHSDFSQDTIQIVWPYTCDHECTNKCGCCKPSLIRKLATEDDYTIVIGDSITDLQAAKLADFVIARDLLVEKCQELKLKHAPFGTFFDVIDVLNKVVRQ